jgi:hypothetical protein
MPGWEWCGRGPATYDPPETIGFHVLRNGKAMDVRGRLEA